MKAKETLETLQTYPITHIIFLPGLYIRAVREDLRNFQFPKLRICKTTGEPMDKEVMRKWKESTGIDLRESYGQTEMVSA